MAGGAGQRTCAEPEQRPHGGQLPRAVGVGVSGRIVGVGLPDGEAQRSAPLLAHEPHVRTEVNEQSKGIGVVVLRCHDQRRGPRPRDPPWCLARARLSSARFMCARPRPPL